MHACMHLVTIARLAFFIKVQLVLVSGDQRVVEQWAALPQVTRDSYSRLTDQDGDQDGGTSG